MATRVLCNCGKQVAFLEEYYSSLDVQSKQFKDLKESGYALEEGENLKNENHALSPCLDRICSFSKKFSINPGFHGIY
jgi:chromosome condensin MukBEF ATPase and DNA-binding subunit MukB